MSGNSIPERWLDHYACIIDGEVEDARLEQQLIEELGAAEASLSEAREENSRLASRWKVAKEVIDYRDRTIGYLKAEIERLKLEEPNA